MELLSASIVDVVLQSVLETCVKRKSYKILIRKPGSTKLLDRHNCEKINIKFYLKAVGFENGYKIRRI
jgi:hypothetical protein